MRKREIPEIENRDRLIARVGASHERLARAVREALRKSPDEARVSLTRLARGLDESARELRWLGEGRLDPPRRKRLDLVRVVRETVRAWTPGLTRRGVSVTVEASPESISGQWDRAHLSTITSELLSNAVKHGAGGPIRVSIEADADVARLLVCDIGTGSLPKRPFRRFVRGPGAVGEGMGVGLWLVDAITKANGGTLRFERGAGGTTVVVSLRLRPPSGD